MEIEKGGSGVSEFGLNVPPSHLTEMDLSLLLSKRPEKQGIKPVAPGLVVLDLGKSDKH